MYRIYVHRLWYLHCAYIDHYFLARVVAASELLLTSNVAVGGGRHIAATGEEVIFTCMATDSSSLLWDSMSFDGSFLRYTASGDDYVGRIKFSEDGSFRSNLTMKVSTGNRRADFTSTLTFTANEQHSQLVINCSTGESNATATVYLSGNIIMESTFVVRLNEWVFMLASIIRFPYQLSNMFGGPIYVQLYSL